MLGSIGDQLIEDQSDRYGTLQGEDAAIHRERDGHWPLGEPGGSQTVGQARQKGARLNGRTILVAGQVEVDLSDDIDPVNGLAKAASDLLTGCLSLLQEQQTTDSLVDRCQCGG
jgi:hypothetical protein